MGIEEAEGEGVAVPTIESRGFGGDPGHFLHPPIVCEKGDGPGRAREFAAAWGRVLTRRRLREAEAEALRQTRILLPAADSE